MSGTGCQNNPIYLNFYLQKSLESFEKNSADKMSVDKNSRWKVPCPVLDKPPVHCTEVRFASFLSSGFTTLAVIIHRKGNPKLPTRTSVHCLKFSEVQCPCLPPIPYLKAWITVCSSTFLLNIILTSYCAHYVASPCPKVTIELCTMVKSHNLIYYVIRLYLVPLLPYLGIGSVAFYVIM